jgi:hypothetical protein
VTSSDTGLAFYLTPIAWVTTRATVSKDFSVVIYCHALDRNYMVQLRDFIHLQILGTAVIQTADLRLYRRTHYHSLKCYNALSSRDLGNKDWEVVKTQLIKSYRTQINTTAACIVISKLYQGSKSVLDYFSEVSEVCKFLIKLTPKD